MCTKSEQAADWYNQAYLSEQKGEATLAEIYYLKSGFLFEQVGGPCHLNAANAMNALAYLRWSRKDYDGALRAAKESMRIIETVGLEFASADVDLIRDTSWELVDQMLYELSLACR